METDNLGTFTGALGLSFEFNPIELTAAGRYGFNVNQGGGRPILTSIDPESKHFWNLESGIYYVGRRDFEIGLSVSSQIATARDKRLIGIIGLGYYW